jgi:truncated hemoglobin YjbI
MQGTLYDQLGGEAKLRQIIDTFIDRVFEDRMIGFFFRNADRKRSKQMELQLTARFLGADVEYQGRPLDEVMQHPIMGGQFARTRSSARR